MPGNIKRGNLLIPAFKILKKLIKSSLYPVENEKYFIKAVFYPDGRTRVRQFAFASAVHKPGKSITLALLH